MFGTFTFVLGLFVLKIFFAFESRFNSLSNAPKEGFFVFLFSKNFGLFSESNLLLELESSICKFFLLSPLSDCFLSLICESGLYSMKAVLL